MEATLPRRRKRTKSPVVFKGGDGGTLPTHGAVGGASPHADAKANGRVYLTCQDAKPRRRAMARPAARSLEVPTFETADESDRAHAVREHTGMLVPAGNRRMVKNSRARRYPASQMTSRGVAWDSSFDELYEMQGRLAGVPGLGRAGNASQAAAMVEECVRRTRADLRLRDVLERNRGVYELPSALSTKADDAERWLARHDPEYWAGVADAE